MTMLPRAALAYAKKGWAVFPLQGKKPFAGTHGVKDATSEVDEVRSAWTLRGDQAGIGLGCGEPSGVWVLDVDDGDEGVADLAELEREFGGLPETLQAGTGGGGRHLFFRLGEGQEWPKNKVRFTEHLDVRSTGGYVVLPPSVHPSGRRYTWVDKAVQPAVAPDWLLARIAEGRRKPVEESTLPLAVRPVTEPVSFSDEEDDDGSRRVALAALEGACRDVEQAGRGAGAHGVLFGKARKIGGYVGAGLLDRDHATRHLIEAARGAGRDARTVQRAVDQGIELGMKSPIKPAVNNVRMTRDEVLAWLAERPSATSADAAMVSGVPAATIRRWTIAERGAAFGGRVPVHSGSEQGFDEVPVHGEQGFDEVPVHGSGTPVHDEQGLRHGEQGFAEAPVHDLEAPVHDEQGFAEAPVHDEDRTATPQRKAAPAYEEPSEVVDVRAAMRALLMRVALVEDRAEKLTTLESGLHGLVEDLALARTLDEHAAIGDVQGARLAARGASRVVDAFEKAVRARVRKLNDARPAPVRGVLEDAPGDDAELPEGVNVPSPYALKGNGVWKLVTGKDGQPEQVRVTHAPLTITGALIDEDSDEIRWVLDFTNLGRSRRATASRSSCLDARRLLSEVPGAPVSGANGRGVVEYLAAYEGANADTLPRASYTGRMGWHGRRFFVGTSVIEPGDDITPQGIEDIDPAEWGRHRMFVVPPDGLDHVGAGFTSSGDMEMWMDAIRLAERHPAAMVVLYASFASVLLHHVPEAPAFVVELAGDTSKGKTTALRVAASVWGTPDDAGGVLGSWNSSPTSIERQAAFLQHLPLILDDTMRVDEKSRDRLVQVVYNITSGRGKGRGSITGVQATSTFRCLLLSSGEQPITSFSRSAGGAAARSIVLTGSPFRGQYAAADARDIHSLLLEHYGLAGPRFVQYLLNHAGERSTWRKRFAELRDERQHGISAPAERRVAGYVAFLELAAELVEDALGIGVHRRALEMAGRVASESGASADVAAEAYDVALTWALSHEDRFFGRYHVKTETERPPTAGWAGVWHAGDRQIAFLPDVLRQVITHAGLSYTATLRSWAERKMILTDENDKDRNPRPNRLVRLRGERVRCVVLIQDDPSGSGAGAIDNVGTPESAKRVPPGAGAGDNDW